MLKASSNHLDRLIQQLVVKPAWAKLAHIDPITSNSIDPAACCEGGIGMPLDVFLFLYVLFV